MTEEIDRPDIVDVHLRPFARALGNLVITFAQCENELLGLVTAMVGGAELGAVAILKDRSAKDRVIELVQGLGLAEFDLNELVSGIEGFWKDKEARNRLIHDEWFPSQLEPGTIATRGVTRTKEPRVIFHDRNAADVWALAKRFQEYDSLFSHRRWAISGRDG
jgi:hypothetical protein